MNKKTKKNKRIKSEITRCYDIGISTLLLCLLLLALTTIVVAILSMLGKV